METHNKQKIIAIFGQYIPPEIVEKINKSPDGISMESETKEMSVLFCDLHGFTNFSEQLSPKKVSEVLNIYFTEISESLHALNATIDKFIGDAVMAFWGAPLQQDNHAELAMIASFKIQESMKKLAPLFAKHGWDVAEVGVGISSGDMHVGNMGSKYRVTCTVIGDTVNLASRLEGLTRFYSVPTIISEATITEGFNILFRELDTTVVRGKLLSTRIFQPICFLDQATTEIKNELEQQNEALQEYYKKQYKTAANMFSQLAKDYPADPYYQVMQKKIAVLSNPAITTSY